MFHRPCNPSSLLWWKVGCLPEGCTACERGAKEAYLTKHHSNLGCSGQRRGRPPFFYFASPVVSPKASVCPTSKGRCPRKWSNLIAVILRRAHQYNWCTRPTLSVLVPSSLSWLLLFIIHFFSIIIVLFPIIFFHAFRTLETGTLDS